MHIIIDFKRFLLIFLRGFLLFAEILTKIEQKNRTSNFEFRTFENGFEKAYPLNPKFAKK